jgi:DNA-binding winged helix-turn-helix (wHTH) protein/tetratricopeptide (TPR) repeat protein
MRYIFGDCILDTERYELLRASVRIPLRPKVFQLLAYLITHRDRVVVKDELIEHLWPKQFVGDAVLKSCIMTARKVVGDAGRSQRIIQTLHGHGYRFVAAVAAAEQSPPAGASLPVASLEPQHTQATVMRQDVMARPPGDELALPAEAEAGTTGDQAAPCQAAGEAAASLPPVWEHRPVAVLAIELTFPTSAVASEGWHADPWTMATRWQRLIEDKVQGFGGVILQRAASFVLAAFGVPRALEQMPQRAVQAALAMRQLVQAAQTPSAAAPSPQLRLAAHLGTVLLEAQAGIPSARELGVGETFALPVRLLGHARPGELLVSAAVGRQIEGEFTLQARALPSLHGSSDSEAYAVVGQQLSLAPAARMQERTLRPFVGRHRELETLHALLGQVAHGQGQVIGIVGEPGMGKSRLLFEFCLSIRGQEKPVTYLEGHCLSYRSTIPYGPVLDLLRQHCGITATDGPEAITAKVTAMLSAASMAPAEEAPYLLRLLEVPADTERLAQLSPETLQRRTFATLRQLLLRSVQQHPLVVAVENLHWIDVTSQAYFASLVEYLVGMPLLLLVTYRPGYRPPWIDKSYVTQMALQPLPPDDSRRVVAAICHETPLPPPLLHAILEKAEGNPLFLEELARVAADHGHSPLSLAVPDTIQGVLRARLDRLSDATREVLQTAALLGRKAPRWLLEALWEGAGELSAHLHELQRLELLFERVEAEDTVYVFKHALIRDVAYESCPPLRRQALHAAAGGALEVRYADHPEQALELLAYHYARADAPEKAVAYLRQCADKAVQSYAHGEAVALLAEARRHAAWLPAETREQHLLELALRQSFSYHYLARFQDSLDLLLSQRERLERLGDPTLTGPYYFLLGLTYSCLSAHQQAIELTGYAVEAAQRCGDTTTLGEAYYELCFATYSLGRYQEGVDYGQQAVALLERSARQPWLSKAHLVLAFSHAHLGAFPAALASATQLEAMGEVSGDPRAQSFAALITGWCKAMQGEWEAGIAACQRGLACAPDPFSTVLATCFLGQAYLEQGDQAQAIPILQQSLRQFHQFGYRQGEGRCAALLGEAYLLHGDIAQAQDLAHQGLEISREVDNGYWVGWAQRVLGQIPLAGGQLSEADSALHAALRTFATLQARFEVGRTRLTLAALAQAQDDLVAAATHLRTAHGLFETLQVPRYVERTAQLASAFGVALTPVSPPVDAALSAAPGAGVMPRYTASSQSRIPGGSHT